MSAPQPPLKRPRAFPLFAVANTSKTSHDTTASLFSAEASSASLSPSHDRGRSEKSAVMCCSPVDAVVLSSHGEVHGCPPSKKHPRHGPDAECGSEQWAGNGGAPAGTTPITVPPRLKTTMAAPPAGLANGLAHT
jgi:hypothetical protein